MSKLGFYNIGVRFLFFAIPLGWFNSAIALSDPNYILGAINSRICWQTFWEGDQWYKLGSTDEIMVDQTGNITYVWSDSISLVPNVSKWVDFFVLYSEGNRYIVRTSYGKNLDSEEDRVNFQKNLSMIGALNVVKLKIKIPSDCNPRFEANSSRKNLMLNGVMNSVVQQVKAANKSAPVRYPNNLKIVISNFNTDYPEAFVLIPSMRKILVVSFINSSPIEEQKGDYVVNEVSQNYGETASYVYNEMSQKILKYGIDAEINLGVQPH